MSFSFQQFLALPPSLIYTLEMPLYKTLLLSPEFTSCHPTPHFMKSHVNISRILQYFPLHLNSSKHFALPQIYVDKLNAFAIIHPILNPKTLMIIHCYTWGFVHFIHDDERCEHLLQTVFLHPHNMTPLKAQALA